MEKKKLIICCDGTWNKPTQEQYGVPTPTNVFRIYNAVADSDQNNIRQLTYYHPGVGVEFNLIKKLLGGIMGFGLDKIIKSGYGWLCTNYNEGDEIYIFGFSRGAYTARCLAGMIGICGLLASDERMWMRINKAYAAGYRTGQPSGKWRKENDRKTVPVHFLGVWDTVGALGIPDDLILLNLFDFLKKNRFQNTGLGDNVRWARHALSLDDKRSSFTPTLWTDIRQHDIDSGRVKQVWFPGEHGDVGGGKREKGLSDGALLWMINEAEQCGLFFKNDMVKQLRPDYQDVEHNACAGMYQFLRRQPRNIPAIDGKNVGTLIHESAYRRQCDPPIAQAPYRPTCFPPQGGPPRTVDIFACERWNETGIYLEQDATYAFEATGEWLDAWIKCGPEGGNTRGLSFPARIFYFMADLLVAFNFIVLKTLLRNRNADFWGLVKKVDNQPWFALIGVVANCDNPDTDGTPQPHDYFKIGNGTRKHIERPGYLYCFANDGWNRYRNNRGSVRLSVTRV